MENRFLLLIKKMLSKPHNYSYEHLDLLNKMWPLLSDLVAISNSGVDIPKLNEVLMPMGIPLGTNKKDMIKHIGISRICSRHDFSVSKKNIYSLYSVYTGFDQWRLNTQFHLLDDQLYMVKTDFLTQLSSNLYECFLNGFIGPEYNLNKYTGILPYYMKDTQSNLLQVHNPLGYPTVTYYTGNTKLQSKIEFMLKQKTLN